jgi:hypothetical protein
LNCLKCGKEIIDYKRTTKKYCCFKCRKSAENKRSYARKTFPKHKGVFLGTCQRCGKQTHVYLHWLRSGNSFALCLDCYSLVPE